MLTFLVTLLVRPYEDALTVPEGLTIRQILATTLGCIWAVRLGSYLFMRVMQMGKDERFDELKNNPVKFAVPWFLQIVWIYLTGLAVWIINGNRAMDVAVSFGTPTDIVGLIVWIIGFAIEVTADAQKTQFKKQRPKDFCNVGVFKLCRYPNYFGECLLWLGMWIMCISGFTASWNWVSVISPIFVFCLIYFVSGVPLLEKSSKERYGAREDYQRYRLATSQFIPWFPKSSSKVDELMAKRVEPLV